MTGVNLSKEEVEVFLKKKNFENVQGAVSSPN